MDAKLKFCFGAMGCGKTRKLQGDYYSKLEDGFHVIVMKPVIDKKGDDKTLARDGGEVRVDIMVSSNDDIYFLMAKYLIHHNVDFVLVDEAQFLEKEQIDQLTNIVDIFNINVICYGLRTDFMGNLFEGSKRLFETADELYMVKRQCSCGNDKIYNMRLENGNPVFEGDIVAIDGIDASYKSLCRSCYKSETKKIRKKSKCKD